MVKFLIVVPAKHYSSSKWLYGSPSNNALCTVGSPTSRGLLPWIKKVQNSRVRSPVVTLVIPRLWIDGCLPQPQITLPPKREEATNGALSRQRRGRFHSDYREQSLSQLWALASSLYYILHQYGTRGYSALGADEAEGTNPPSVLGEFQRALTSTLSARLSRHLRCQQDLRFFVTNDIIHFISSNRSVGSDTFCEIRRWFFLCE